MIELRDVTKQYGETVILNGADYTFPQRGLVCLMGPSGAGKTTLLNLLAGFDTDYSGGIAVGGALLRELDGDALCRYRRDNIGFVFQNYHLLAGHTALENVCLARSPGVDPMETEKQAISILERLGIGEKSSQKAETLSGGQKQRVAIARALMGNPQIILADEPTGALDRANSTEIMELLRGLAAQRLVVVITHDRQICSFADEVISIQDGNIVSDQSAPNPPPEHSLRTDGAASPSLPRTGFIAARRGLSLPPGHGAHCASVRVVIRTAGVKLSRFRRLSPWFYCRGLAFAFLETDRHI